MKPCDGCIRPAYCEHDGLCWLDETRREDEAQRDRDRFNAVNKQRYEKRLVRKK